ncbi:hypothetical protein AVEN_242736-1 [Araneus ventricosus]|uniref:Uncharacterized protein n=1 Tax=Araneus ventricosus TaxID=182803 RepID=A0A4Y2H312_ARAVE|nr:hypothetical protein AVEN_32527-1 [Araneus ventricosus]GBM59481.1 hypothetical protein AVEN_242736-1 [Araneus ventricosus]
MACTATDRTGHRSFMEHFSSVQHYGNGLELVTRAEPLLNLELRSWKEEWSQIKRRTFAKRNFVLLPEMSILCYAYLRRKIFEWLLKRMNRIPGNPGGSDLLVVFVINSLQKLLIQ